MTTSEQRAAELIAWARTLVTNGVGTVSTLSALKQLADALEASETEKRRIIEAVRYVPEAVIDHSYASAQLERACGKAEGVTTLDVHDATHEHDASTP